MLVVLAILVLGLVALCIRKEGGSALIVVFLGFVVFLALIVLGLRLDIDPGWLFGAMGF